MAAIIGYGGTTGSTVYLNTGGYDVATSTVFEVVEAIEHMPPPREPWPWANPWDRTPKRAKQKTPRWKRREVRRKATANAKHHKKAMTAVNAAKLKRGEPAARHR